ncbi:MAG: NAD(P)/FAD-dependent oxidoreductase [Candidatus Methylarchaceae archaeon HK01M]|nr:NAD(P)/FAD-dependent oxidoreductase [Candidatus Methylarchaceae archaeon HK01M]
MNGYDTEIFELHTKPGGLCTGWRRKGYTIDGCVHWLVGSSPSVNYYKFWNELIDMKELKIVDYEEYCSLEDEEGKRLRAFANVDRLEKEMKDIAPEDAKAIDEFINGVKTFIHFEPPIEKAPEVMNFFDKIKMIFKILPKMRSLKKWISLNNEDYAHKFRNPLLKKIFTIAFHPKIPVMIVLMTFVWFHKNGAGYPVGGSLKIVDLMEKKYLNNGGKIHYRSKVTKIIVKDNVACGIELENGEKHNTDIVVSAADGHYTIFEMLEEKYKDKNILDLYYNEKFEPQTSTVYVSIGVSRTFEDESYKPWLFFPLEEPLIIDDKTQMNEIAVTIHNFDPSAAEPGKTVLTLMLDCKNPEYWINLRKTDKNKYNEKKEHIAKDVILFLEKRFGNIESNVEVCDIATPATYARYTNNWKGSTIGWQDPEVFITKTIKKEIEGLMNFYMCGQWVGDGGLPMALTSGRNVAQIICKRDKKSFRTAL